MVTLALETCVLPLFGKFLSSQIQNLHDVLLTLILRHGYTGTGKLKLESMNLAGQEPRR